MFCNNVIYGVVIKKNPKNWTFQTALGFYSRLYSCGYGISIIFVTFMRSVNELFEYVSSNWLHEKMIFHKLYICDLCVPHELYGCVFSKFLLEKMIYYKIYICSLCGLHELCGCVSSNIVNKKKIYHKIHTCNLCGLYELYEYACSNVLIEKMIYHKIHICNLWSRCFTFTLCKV